uniref:TMEM248/TMEM219 domain-containing protein n=3 Tax=Magallana gigas TaxID=29159 RepID=A0A8W8MS80_MAGGI|nr:transmembrane protein 248 isoform X1 [Crassostrea gigas]XP_034317955.1 transmembrane protein 248 isoform X1 [Crassostrea gigas]|eukprot:XP_011442020.1 PREDICTED: transmembrane protein 248 [Crassostrea gigas]
MKFEFRKKNHRRFRQFLKGLKNITAMAFDCAICENLKSFFKNKPPMVLFVISLGAFALVLLTLAYIIKVQELPNPDLTKEWNHFFENFAEVEFCVLGNQTEDTITTTAEPKLSDTLLKLHDKVLKTTPPPIDEHVVNTSISMLIEVTPSQSDSFFNISNNVTTLLAAVNGSELGLRGMASKMSMNVSMMLPIKWNEAVCTDKNCQKIQILTCINFQGPASIFPSKRHFGGCTSTVGVTEGVTDYSSRMVGYPRSYTEENLCAHLPRVTMKYKLDPTMNMLLTLEDRSIINLHLMHTTYFLFVMFVTIICYALIRGHPATHKNKSGSYSEVSTKV